MTFIAEIAPYAKRVQEESNILASLLISQAILESAWGKSKLAKEGKNLFGIKGSYNGQSVEMPTWEVVKGQKVEILAAFRKYPSWYESFQDLANLYLKGVSWDRHKYKLIIGESNYRTAANAVQSAGYATDLDYAQKLITIIESHNLTKYDLAIHPSQIQTPASQSQKYYKVVQAIPGYFTADNAKSRTSQRTVIKEGTYIVFNESQGMINITMTKGVPGSWINPNDHAPIDKQAVYHLVAAGETLSELAVKYGTSIQAISALNTLKNVNTIYIGQKLRIK
ncbi:glucosaminidase domain-containing protein [Cytobacillus gottheilii]|uniref:glucosaminidase domain-containing protein n=1 Tax=Cytobacillus gottheilii TaxID=859144 RepID=UPI0024952C2E|nr:glucosaminidase domain-containing protein [Cytobacillus gottheilii]